MRIIWVVNTPIGPLAEQLGVKNSSGSWLTASMDNIDLNATDLYVVTTYPVKETIKLQSDRITYIALKGKRPSDYSVTDQSIEDWKMLYESIMPDIIQVWGTEYAHSLAAVKAKPQNVTALVYVQGVMKSVYQHYYGGLTTRELLKNTSLIELLTGKSVFAAHKKIKKSSEREEKVVELSDGIIYETEWSKAYYLLSNKNLKLYKHALPVNRAFDSYRWKYESCSPHNIFTPASDYPLKGVHSLLKAIALVKEKYPDVKLNIPGARVEKNQGIKQRIKTRAYRRCLGKLISELDLWDNINFTGVLTTEQMAQQMQIANLFVCTSFIENHSSTLREAMTVGVPCITTCVGGIPEYFVNGRDGIMYEPSDYVSLAGNIMSVFSDPDLQKTYSKNGFKSIRDYYSSVNTDLMQIYKKIMNSKS